METAAERRGPAAARTHHPVMDTATDEVMDSATDETALVRAARSGDRVAFGRLHQLYARMVHGILLARVPRADCLDLVQEVFLKALRKLDALRDGAAFGPWLAAIARNRACDYHRSTHKVVDLTEEIALPSRSEAEAEAELALAALRELPDAYRETLLLRLVEGLSGPEIAAQTGRTPGSVRVNLHRGLRLLRERLGLAPGGGEARAGLTEDE
jgi:RNA polymerase sigma-70 factor (ECF subfamily)